MKKGEKPPEMEAFERAFGRGGQGASDPGEYASPGWSPANQPAARRQSTPPSSIGRQSTPPAGLSRQTTPPAGLRPSGLSSPSAQSRASGTAPSQRLSQSFGRVASTTREWDEDRDEDEEAVFSDEMEAEPFSQGGPRASRPAPVVRDRLQTVLARVVLALVALYAAYSLQSHSQKNYAYSTQESTSAPGTAVEISALSYDAGWPLTYAHVGLQNLPVSDLTPAPTLRDIQPVALLVDVLLLAAPLWLLLEAVWLFWAVVLSRFGPRTPVRRFIAVGLTGIPATLWLVSALALGGYLSMTNGAPSAWPKVAWLALAPAIPGFNLASAVSSVLAVPPNLWRLDFGIFLLVMGLPIVLLTACLYACFCLIGRGLRRGGRRRAGE